MNYEELAAIGIDVLPEQPLLERIKSFFRDTGNIRVTRDELKSFAKEKGLESEYDEFIKGFR